MSYNCGHAAIEKRSGQAELRVTILITTVWLHVISQTVHNVFPIDFELTCKTMR